MRSSFVLLLLTGWIPACGASVRTMDVSHVPTYTIASMNAAPKESGIALKNSLKEGAVILLKKGDKVPVQLRVSYGPAALEPGQNYFVFSQDTYLYIGPNGILLSPDSVQWAPVSDAAALAKVFGLKKKGTFQFGFGVREGNPASFTIAAERQ